jgi:hypothetical protein
MTYLAGNVQRRCANIHLGVIDICTQSQQRFHNAGVALPAGNVKRCYAIVNLTTAITLAPAATIRRTSSSLAPLAANANSGSSPCRPFH